MADAIGPGDYVECVCVEGPDEDGSGWQVGHIYLVTDVGVTEDGDGWLLVANMPTPLEALGIDAPGWSIEAFRPVYRPKASVIAVLKQPAPELESA